MPFQNDYFCYAHPKILSDALILADSAFEIRNIASQTDLLALNVTIEAATGLSAQSEWLKGIVSEFVETANAA